MRILLIGANGQLAQDVLLIGGDRHRWAEFIPVTHEQLDIRDAATAQALIEQHRPECIVNTAAFHQVDRCEDEPETAFAVNRDGVRNLAEAAKGADALLVQFSTDYVFDGAKRSPYTENDEPNPQSVYAKSRLAGEQAVRNSGCRYLLIRTCGLYGLVGSKSKSGNFVETMLKLAVQRRQLRVVNDQICTPTSTRDLAEAVLSLVKSGAEGLFHLTNTGECSWYEFAREIFRLSRMNADLSPCSTADYAAKAARPAYSVLDNAAFRATGFSDLRSWQDALAEYIERRAHTLGTPQSAK